MENYLRKGFRDGRLDCVVPRIARLRISRSTNDEARKNIKEAIELYLQKNLGYTLQLPGFRESDPIANFLFERKKGSIRESQHRPGTLTAPVRWI